MSIKVTPSKLKGYLSLMKDRYLLDQPLLPSDSHNDHDNLKETFLGILKMELLLRGIVVEDDTRIYKEILSSVGKTVLVDNPSLKIPKQLLVGANVMAGRIVEVFYNQLTTALLPLDRTGDSSNADNKMLSNNFIPYDDFSDAINRSKEIEDERWLVLLQQIPILPSPSTSNTNNYFNSILQIALGYYCTAASIQSDTPPIWKKIWDVWTLLDETSTEDESLVTRSDHSSPYEAQIAIENLIRIAVSKQNDKRASELRLRLAQSYLNQNRIALVGYGTKNKNNIAQNFGDSITLHLPQSQLCNADSTLLACEPYFEQQINEMNKSGSSYIDSEIMLYQILQVEILMAKEDVRNSQHDMIEDQLVERVTILRDALIASWRSTFSTCLNSKDDKEKYDCIIQLCFYWVHRCIIRLKDSAEYISRKTGSYYKSWNLLLQYILPILKEMEDQIAEMEKSISYVEATDNKTRVQASIKWLDKTIEQNGTKNSKMMLIETVVSLIPNAFWMSIGDSDEHIIMDPLEKEFVLVADILSGMIQWQERVEAKRLKRENAAPTVGSKESFVIISTQRWQNMKESALCFVCQDNNALISRITMDAIASSKKKIKRGFLTFLQCLLGWSGFFQHPWPYYTKISDAKRLLKAAKTDLGRPLTELEDILLELASADAELLNGGFAQNASNLYSKVLENLGRDEITLDEFSRSLLQAHCYNGLARVQQACQIDNDGGLFEESQSMKGIQILEDTDVPFIVRPLSIWNSRPIFVASKAHELSVGQQLVADSLIRFCRFEEAVLFLKKAVFESPLDAHAAMALGSFLLRSAFYIHKERSKARDKEAQIHLLKAAKLDSSKPVPFALLGIWYEEIGDLKRAVGCFLKSLKLDPCNPIAGRGLLRLATNRTDYKDILETAIDSSSSLNGWAWHAVGLIKSYIDGDDELAVVAILKSLRCRDIVMPEKEVLGVFYAPSSSYDKMSEKSAALADVGMCYRRLGRFTASIRTFRASIFTSGKDCAQSATLISCAQVEQELGSFDEAAEKFDLVIQRNDINISIALHGYALAMYSMAKRDLIDGKAGAAFCRIKLAIKNCLNSSMEYGCEKKLVGDLYSFGASFPFRVFCCEDNPSEDAHNQFRKQLDFVSRGEDEYRSYLTALNPENDEEASQIAIKSEILYDIAMNVLLQAQLFSSAHIDSNSTEIYDKYDRAAESFRQVIEYNPIHAASWCGFGCSVLKNDPLLAQHAFSRCAQIESMFPEAYANVGFLYTSKVALNASRSTMEVLTQIADSPMMWMNCAFMFEREAERNLAENNRGSSQDKLIQAADAYRASLQVMRHPEAQFGLSLTGRMLHSNEETKHDIPSLNMSSLKRKDCLSFLNEYKDSCVHSNGAASLVQGVMSLEKGSSIPQYALWQNEIFCEGKEIVELAQKQGEEKVSSGSLDAVLINKLAVACMTLEHEHKRIKSPPCVPLETEINIQREIWKQPDRADLWLSLAKIFVEKGAVKSAETAASRAAFILSRELNSSASNSQAASTVNAILISEATALEYLLKEIQTKRTLDTTYALQRALIMNPGNVVARKGLLFGM